ncbi:hypothetical protein C5E10_01980 [Pseudoclavibacter sp. RFBG4]|uniref:hypothetical protein n=1 Tax=Pseudoclavibacter sp. RFBG4 TaxID=2080575 RepID=UPI000CE82546|nr:hypothetical protein [Pseudoclavibacter sp. RFBG4]PPG36007.1 hypothetical protein C5E10_01980 [Pseudoclavibacter sp. RFBG4]
MRRRIIAAGLAAITLGVSVCVSGCSPAEVPGRAPAIAAASPSAPTQLVRGPQDDHVDTQPPGPSPTHDEASDAEALAVASAAIEAYLGREISPRVWLEALEPHLTASAMAALSSVDPTTIPGASLTAATHLERHTSGYLAHVTAPTESGSYRLLLVRDGSSRPWLVAEITPQESSS